MPNRTWKIKATGRDASALNRLRIVYVEDPNKLYYLIAPPSTTLARGDSPSFNNFRMMDGTPWTWSLSSSGMSPNPGGTYVNDNPAPNLASENGSWQSDAVPEPLPPSLAEGKESKESKESAGADS
jgi:hypothetical protein